VVAYVECYDGFMGLHLGWASTRKDGLPREELKIEDAGLVFFQELSCFCKGERTQEKDRTEAKHRWRDMKKNRETRPTFFKTHFIKTSLSKILQISLFSIC
jgi:hypothetical protein